MPRRLTTEILTEMPLLTRSDCARACQGVHELRSLWIPRGPAPASFFTLGVASYQDLGQPLEGFTQRDYYGEAPELNRSIAQKFVPLFRLVQDALQAYLKAETYLAPRTGIPGFHIFDHAAIPTTDVASIHFDLQYQLLDWKDGDLPPDYDNPISFTLPLRLPKRGAGMNVWDLTYEAVVEGRFQNIVDYAKTHKPTLHFYTLGTLVIHSGHYLHQIAGVPEVEADEQRITLQGHGLQRGKRWLLYW
jgi:hypothetical protein